MREQLTEKDVERIEAEIEHRKLVVRKEAIEAVKEARAHGDLSENFEYHAAKKDKNKNKNNKNSVILFKIVCIATSFLLEINPQTTLPFLMIAIIKIQVHNYVGNCIHGSIFTKHTATNTLSATVSNLALNSLVVFVFLAISPSTISVIPQNRYII